MPFQWGKHWCVVGDSITKIRNSQNYQVCSEDKSEEVETGGAIGTHKKRNAHNFDGGNTKKDCQSAQPLADRTITLQRIFNTMGGRRSDLYSSKIGTSGGLL